MNSPDRALCPACGAVATPAFAPFCTQGCKDRDLLKWLSDGHRLPGPPAEGRDFEGDGVDS